MATRAPFGTDLQPKFDVRVVAGKIVHTPVVDTLGKEWSRGHAHSSSSKVRSRDSSISGAIKSHKRLKDMRGHVPMDQQRTREIEGVSTPSKRSRNIDILPALEEGAGEMLEEPSPQKVANNRTVQPTIQIEYKLPSIIVQPPVSNDSYEPSSVSDDLSQAAGRLKAKELQTLVKLMFKPIVNKLGTIEAIRQSCRRADKSKVGIVDKKLVMNVFRSHGAMLSSADLFKLSELISCGVGADHILYEKLCTILTQIFNEACTNLTLDKTVNTTTTPCGSIGSVSPDSVEDYKLGCTLPMLVDRTNSYQHLSLPFERSVLGQHKESRSVKTHPLVNSQSKSKLPPISSKPTNKSPPVASKANSKWPMLLGEQDEENGVEKMYNALRSCTDHQGLLERDHAQRVVQNYNLIYKLGLPTHLIRDYLKTNTHNKAGDLKPYVVTDRFLQYLSNAPLNVVR